MTQRRADAAARAHPVGILALAGMLLAAPRGGSTQACADPHYRWTQKIDESLAGEPAVRASVTTILTRWPVLELTGEAQYRCAGRLGRELRTYAVVGWVRRVKTGESDGDWHIELTARPDSPPDSCIVLEIPPAELGGNYALARQELRSRVTWDGNGDVSPAARLRFIGAAFFDGEHRGGPGRRDQTDGAHGRCNSSARALWEIHPVYWVRPP